MACPELSEFSAWINLQPPDPSRLIVIGKVVTNGGDLQPKLKERVPQGVNQNILLLDLTVEQTGKPGTDDIAPRDVRFDKPAGQGAYKQVEIYFEGERCLTLEVQEAH